MTREEAIKAIKEKMDYYESDKRLRGAIETLIPELAESEDEKIRKEIISFLQDDIDRINCRVSGDYDDRDEDDIEHQNWCKKAIAYLERQKEQKPSINIDQLKSLMLQYLQEASNEKEDSDIEADTDKWARKILGYDFEQKPITINQDEKEFLADEITAFLCNYDKEFDGEDPVPSEIAEHFYLLGKQAQKQKPADEAEQFFDSAESYHQGFIAGQKKMKEDIEKGFGIGKHSFEYLAGRYAGYEAGKKEQKPAVWSEEDENALNYFHELISFGITENFFDAQTAYDMRKWLNTRLESLRPRLFPKWK